MKSLGGVGLLLAVFGLAATATTAGIINLMPDCALDESKAEQIAANFVQSRKAEFERRYEIRIQDVDRVRCCQAAKTAHPFGRFGCPYFEVSVVARPVRVLVSVSGGGEAHYEGSMRD